MVRTHRLGDVLQAIPQLHALKQRHRSAKVHLLVSDQYQRLLDGNPDVDKVIPLPLEELKRVIHLPGGFRRAQGILDPLIDELNGERYNLVINRQFSRFELCLLGSIETRALLGPYYSPDEDAELWRKNLWRALENELPSPQASFHVDRMTARHSWNILYNRKGYRRNLVDVGLELAGLPDPGPVHLPLKSADRSRARARFHAAGFTGNLPLLGVQVGASTPFRHLKPGLVIEVMKTWARRHGGGVVFFGTREERKAVDTVINGLDSGLRVLNLAGCTDLIELAAGLERIDLLLTPDTGTMHLAAMVEVPTVSVFFGAAYPWETGPYGKNHLMLFADLPCAPCAAPAKCPFKCFCRSLMTPEKVGRVLELGFGLGQRHRGENKGRLTREWAARWAGEYAASRLRVLFTGWKEIARPINLMDLTAPARIPKVRNYTPLNLEEIPVAAP
jgi:ADP-heptose:LPS heptosyltransferase